MVHEKSPKTPRFPLNLPVTPTTPNTSLTNFLNFSPTAPSFQEVGNTVDNWLGWQNKYQTTSKLLDQAEKEIARLEAEKQEWLKEKQEFEQRQIKQATHLTSYTQQITQLEITQLEREAKESNDDFYQISEKNQQLTNLLQQKRSENQELVQRLEQEVNENYRLKENQQKINGNLLAKVEELTSLKKLNQQEREEWQNIIAQQSEQFEQEKQARERSYSEQMDNLRTFQLTADLPSRFKRTHKTALSTSSLPTSRSNSPRSSYIIEDDQIIFSPQPTNFKSELNKKGYQESGGIINSNFTTTPQQEETNPFEVGWEKKKKRHSNSPLFVRSPSPAENTQSYEDLVNTVENFAAESVEEGQSNQELLLELEQLKKEKTELERAWKILENERIEHERLLQAFNQKELLWEKERTEQERQLKKFNEEKLAEQQRVKEEIAQLKYELAQSNHKIKERTARAQQILAEKQADYQKLDNDLVVISKLVVERDLDIERLKQEKVEENEKRCNDEKKTFSNLKARLLVAKQEADKLGTDIYQTQILIKK